MLEYCDIILIRIFIEEKLMTDEEKRTLYMRKYEDNRAQIDLRISQGIEKYRKGEKVLCFKDEAGKPLSGKKVKIKQRTHDFKYGANIFMLDQFESADDNALYRSIFKEYFNFATLPFYWNTFEPEEGKLRFEKGSPKIFRRPPTDLCLEYCNENGITPKLHCLYYDKFTPDWCAGYDKKALLLKLEKRFSQIAERYCGKMFEIEVTNELFITKERKTALAFERGIAKTCFDLARKYFPDEKLTINEANQIPDIARLDYYSPYFLQCEGLLLQNTPIDRIGLQNHLFVGASSRTQASYEAQLRERAYWNDPFMYFRALDVMAELKKPLEITEATVPTFGTTEEDEALQADILRLWISVFFSHPAVDAFVYWNTVDDYAYASPDWNENKCRGGLFHRDLTPKMSALVLKKLFSEEWHTECELVTDKNGEVSFRGFFGDYTAECSGRTYGFGVHKSGKSRFGSDISDFKECFAL